MSCITDEYTFENLINHLNPKKSILIEVIKHDPRDCSPYMDMLAWLNWGIDLALVESLSQSSSFVIELFHKKYKFVEIKTELRPDLAEGLKVIKPYHLEVTTKLT